MAAIVSLNGKPRQAKPVNELPSQIPLLMNHDIAESALFANNQAADFPFDMQGSMDVRHHEDCGHNNLPVLNESSILSTSEPILKQDEPTDVSMKLDLDELDEAMI